MGELLVGKIKFTGSRNDFNFIINFPDPQKQSIVVELLLMKKTQARLQQRCVSKEIEDKPT